MSKTTNKFAPEVRERAVRMLLDNGSAYTARETRTFARQLGLRAHPRSLERDLLRALDRVPKERHPD